MPITACQRERVACFVTFYFLAEHSTDHLGPCISIKPNCLLSPSNNWREATGPLCCFCRSWAKLKGLPRPNAHQYRSPWQSTFIHGRRLVFNIGERAGENWGDLCHRLRVLAPSAGGRSGRSRPLPPRGSGVLPPEKLNILLKNSHIFVHICMILDAYTVVEIGNKCYSHFNAQKLETIRPKKLGAGHWLCCPQANYWRTCSPVTPRFGACVQTNHQHQHQHSTAFSLVGQYANE